MSNSVEISSSDRSALVTWAAIPGVGRKTLLRLLCYAAKTDHSLKYLWSSRRLNWVESVLTPQQVTAWHELRARHSVETYTESLAERQISWICLGEATYPAQLAQIPDPPILLFLKGPARWSDRAIGVVGTRKVTSYGEIVTKKITSELIEYDCQIVSGCMVGVDVIAHQVALEHSAHTVGVLGYGFTTVYPSMLKSFLEEFSSSGNTLLTEFAPEVPPLPGNFPLRNRIVAGLSQAVVVTEASAESGSLITAKLAAEYGRVVCAVPSAITSQFHEGTKLLINEGATLVSSGAEVLAELPGGQKIVERKKLEKGRQKTAKKLPLQFPSLLAEKIYVALQTSDHSTDQLVFLLQKPLTNIIEALSLLELKGYIVRSGDRWAIGVFPS